MVACMHRVYTNYWFDMVCTDKEKKERERERERKCM